MERAQAFGALFALHQALQCPRTATPTTKHILVPDGEQQDVNGRYPAGTLLVSPPGSRHAVASEHRCLVLAIWAGPLEFGPA